MLDTDCFSHFQMYHFTEGLNYSLPGLNLGTAENMAASGTKEKLCTSGLEQEEGESYLRASKNIFNIAKFLYDIKIKFAF